MHSSVLGVALPAVQAAQSAAGLCWKEGVLPVGVMDDGTIGNACQRMPLGV